MEQTKNILRTKTKIVLNKEIAPNIYLMGLFASQIAKEAKPGQFIHIKCSTGDNPLLRRPISIHKIEKDMGNIYILFQVKGLGTNKLSKRKIGEYLDVIGPIGKGFRTFSQSQKVMIIGGGMGIAPLLAIAEDCVKKRKEVKALIGAASKKMIFGEKQFVKIGVKTHIATEDGSYQHKGVVTDLIKGIIVKWLPDQIFACGPKEMLKIIAKLAENARINCQVSLEERMGCGIGACLGCVCKIKICKAEDSQMIKNNESFTYKRVCVDGPVFTANEVIWDD